MRTGVDFEAADERRGRLEAIADGGNSKRSTRAGRGSSFCVNRHPIMSHFRHARLTCSEERFFGVAGAGRGDARDGARFGEDGRPPSTVHKILVHHRLAPHEVRQFKVSTDPDFTEKTCEVIGLYMDPPDRRSMPSWTTPSPTSTRPSRTGWRTAGAGPSTSRRPPASGRTRSRASSGSWPAAVSGAASMIPSRISRRRSRNSSRCTTRRRRSRSNGRPPDKEGSK